MLHPHPLSAQGQALTFPHRGGRDFGSAVITVLGNYLLLRTHRGGGNERHEGRHEWARDIRQAGAGGDADFGRGDGDLPAGARAGAGRVSRGVQRERCGCGAGDGAGVFRGGGGYGADEFVRGEPVHAGEVRAGGQGSGVQQACGGACAERGAGGVLCGGVGGADGGVPGAAGGVVGSRRCWTGSRSR